MIRNVSLQITVGVAFVAMWTSSLIGSEAAVLTIHLAGDSTMAIKQEDKRPETGWGEKIGAFFQDGVTVQNYALNGRSALSFRTEGAWAKLLAQIKPGDYVLIQFGHNDQKPSVPQAYSSPEVFQRRLVEFAEEVKARGGHPVLVTSVTRRSFQDNGTLKDTLGEYTARTAAAAAEAGVPLIDLSARSREKIQELGAEKSKQWYLHLSPGEQPNYPKGLADDTHFSDVGAEEIAALVAGEIARVDPEGLARYLKK